MLHTGLTRPALPLVNVDHLVRHGFYERVDVADESAGHRNLVLLAVEGVPAEMLLAVGDAEFNVFSAWQIPAVEWRGFTEEVIGGAENVRRDCKSHAALLKGLRTNGRNPDNAGAASCGFWRR